MIESWLLAVRDHQARPAALQCHVLTMLALRLDWKTGAGFASNKQLGSDADASKNTVIRATGWAQRAGLLLRTRRGHRVSADVIIASEWRLTQSPTGDTLDQGQSPNGADPKSQQGRPKVPPETPHQELSPSGSSPSARALADAGATEEETREILRKIKNNPAVRNAAAYLKAAIANGDADMLIADVRGKPGADGQPSEAARHPSSRTLAEALADAIPGRAP